MNLVCINSTCIFTQSHSLIPKFMCCYTKSLRFIPTVPYTPYVVSVAAINRAGRGESVSKVEFTAEGGIIYSAYILYIDTCVI